MKNKKNNNDNDKENSIVMGEAGHCFFSPSFFKLSLIYLVFSFI